MAIFRAAVRKQKPGGRRRVPRAAAKKVPTACSDGVHDEHDTEASELATRKRYTFTPPAFLLGPRRCLVWFGVLLPEKFGDEATGQLHRTAPRAPHPCVTSMRVAHPPASCRLLPEALPAARWRCRRHNASHGATHGGKTTGGRVLSGAVALPPEAAEATASEAGTRSLNAGGPRGWQRGARCA